jgi:hypothetical protein
MSVWPVSERGLRALYAADLAMLQARPGALAPQAVRCQDLSVWR